MSKATWVNINGTWKQVKNVWENVGGTWKQKVVPKGNISGIWKDFISYNANVYAMVKNTSNYKYKVSKIAVNAVIWSTVEYADIDCFSVDGNGNLYLIVNTNTLIKYDSNGNIIYSKSYDFSFTNSIQIAFSGNIYVGSGYSVKKFDANGNYVNNVLYDSNQLISSFGLDYNEYIYIKQKIGTSYHLLKFNSSGTAIYDNIVGTTNSPGYFYFDKNDNFGFGLSASSTDWIYKIQKSNGSHTDISLDSGFGLKTIKTFEDKDVVYISCNSYLWKYALSTFSQVSSKSLSNQCLDWDYNQCLYSTDTVSLTKYTDDIGTTADWNLSISGYTVQKILSEPSQAYFNPNL